MMSHPIRFTFDEAVQEKLSTEDIVRLSESLQSFVEFGIIDCDEGEEVYVDAEYLNNLVASMAVLQKAVKKYGRDTDGLVKYPFEEM